MSLVDDPDRLSLLALFHEDAQTQSAALSDGLLTLEHAPLDVAALEACMRAAHSLKGAARIIGLQDGVDIAHQMEECFVAAQRGVVLLSGAHIDWLLRGVDLLLRVGEGDTCDSVTQAEVKSFIAGAPVPATSIPTEIPKHTDRRNDWDGAGDAMLHTALGLLDVQAEKNASDASEGGPTVGGAAPSVAPAVDLDASDRVPATRDPGRMLRVHADNLDRLMSLAGESLVESRWLKPFAESMLRARRMQRDAMRALDSLCEVGAQRLGPQASAALTQVRATLGNAQQLLGARIDELDRFDRRSTYLAQQLYDQALQCRMRPFGDATRAYPRIVRDLARSLGKQVKFSIVGEATPIDRDILDMLDAPLGHLLRNALDHGVEAPDVRCACGKPAQASLIVEARHCAGRLLISVSDDGAGIDTQRLRTAVIRRHLCDAETAARLSDPELLEFLLLPGFSMRDEVTDVSGRGVGLDVVHELIKVVRGTVRIFNQPGQGTRFELQLPLTLSVIRSLLVQVGGEAYAFPLAHVRHTLELPCADIDMLEGQQYFKFEGRPVGLVTAGQLLGTAAPEDKRTHVATVVIGDEQRIYGIAVDRFLGERMLVVQTLDARLGKIRDIAAGALLENGDAVLIIDVEDLLHSVDRLVGGGQIEKVGPTQGCAEHKRKHVLVVEDSLTVRELERKLLEKRGYAVTVAVDGMDGWNALRTGSFDLIVTDIDMPRMDGIELVTLVKRDALFRTVPVMIVSYKERDEDRLRGLDAGADYYLSKSSFHDEALLDAVHDLIGEAGA